MAYFNINKPKGLTSHDVVARIKRLTGSIRNPQSAIRNLTKVGHAGTLDPMATGVLPVVVGKATRLVEYLADADKAYRATVILGANSSTYDREGVITPLPDAVMPTIDDIVSALDRFKGEIEQVPPMHSAIKVGGKKLYELARQGIEVERQTRHVTITRLDLEAYDPPTMQIFVECSKGTYIRSLAYDLGAVLWHRSIPGRAGPHPPRSLYSGRCKHAGRAGKRFRGRQLAGEVVPSRIYPISLAHLYCHS